MATEKNFENKVKRYLKSRGAYFVKYWGGGQFTKSGVPDILACVNGFFVAVETKSPTGKPTELQIYNLCQIDQAGGFAFLLYPENFGEFQDIIGLIKDDNLKLARILYNSKRRW